MFIACLAPVIQCNSSILIFHEGFNCITFEMIRHERGTWAQTVDETVAAITWDNIFPSKCNQFDFTDTRGTFLVQRNVVTYITQKHPVTKKWFILLLLPSVPHILLYLHSLSVSASAPLSVQPTRRSSLSAQHGCPVSRSAGGQQHLLGLFSGVQFAAHVESFLCQTLFEAEPWRESRSTAAVEKTLSSPFSMWQSMQFYFSGLCVNPSFKQCLMLINHYQKLLSKTRAGELFDNIYYLEHVIWKTTLKTQQTQKVHFNIYSQWCVCLVNITV